MGWFELEQTNVWDVVITIGYYCCSVVIFGMATYIVGWLNQSCWALFWAYVVVETIGKHAGLYVNGPDDDDGDDGPDGDGGEPVPVPEPVTHINRKSS